MVYELAGVWRTKGCEPVVFKDFSDRSTARWRLRAAKERVSGGGTQLLKCRAFQPIEVAFAGGGLSKDMLRYFKRRDRVSDQEATIHDDFVQRPSHDGDRRGIVFLFHINHRRSPIVGCVIEFVCKGLMNRTIAMSGQIINALVADNLCPLLSA